MTMRNDVNFVPDDFAVPHDAPPGHAAAAPGHHPGQPAPSNTNPDHVPERWRADKPHERGISQQPVPAPEGLVADVKMHDLPDTTDPVGHGSIWLALAVLVVIVLLLSFLWAMYR
jgi:hypothetical protein